MAQEISPPSSSHEPKRIAQARGKTKAAILAGGVLGALGTVVPFGHGYATDSASNILQLLGPYGFVPLGVALALGIFPLVTTQYPRLTLAVFGVSSGVFAIFLAIGLAVWVLDRMLDELVVFGSLSIGFYLTLIGYAAMVCGYYQLQRANGGRRAR